MKLRLVDDNPANDMISYPPDGYELKRSEFTCFRCAFELDCPSRYDWYNTDGDCLENK